MNPIVIWTVVLSLVLLLTTGCSTLGSNLKDVRLSCKSNVAEYTDEYISFKCFEKGK